MIFSEETMTDFRHIRILCLLLCCVLLCGCGAEPALPKDGGAPSSEESADAEPTETAEPEHVRAPYPEVRVYKGRLLWDRGYVCREQVYLPLPMFCRELNMEPITVERDGKVTVQAHGLELSANAGDDYMKVNGRYVLTPGGYLTVGGELYFPAEAADALFNVGVTVAEDRSRVELDMDQLTVISGGEQYYTLNFDSTDVFWLTRIVFAEATHQSLAARIAVANVVLNRTEHPDYPDTIYGVIFDSKGGVQFDPVLDGAVYNSADELSEIAAYMALDGVNVAGNSLFFVNPDKGDDSWFRSALEYVTTVGEHDFYTIRGTK